MNKRGNDSLLPPYAFFSLFFILFYYFFFMQPCGSRTRYISHTSRLPVSLLYHYTTRFSGELPLKKSFLFYLIVNIPKNLRYNLLIHLINHVSAARKHALDFFNQLSPR